MRSWRSFCCSCCGMMAFRYTNWSETAVSCARTKRHTVQGEYPSRSAQLTSLFRPFLSRANHNIPVEPHLNTKLRKHTHGSAAPMLYWLVFFIARRQTAKRRLFVFFKAVLLQLLLSVCTILYSQFTHTASHRQHTQCRAKNMLH